MSAKGYTRTIGGLVLLAGCAFLVVSLLTHNPAEGPFPDYVAEATPSNACGAAGAHASAYALALFGWAAYLLGMGMGLMGVVLIAGGRLTGLAVRGAGLLLICVAAMVGLAMLNAGPAATAADYSAGPGQGGGALGILLTQQLYRSVGSTGTLILAAFSLCVGALLAGGAELAFLYEKAAAVAGSVSSGLTGRLRSWGARREERRAAGRADSAQTESAAEIVPAAEPEEPETEQPPPAEERPEKEPVQVEPEVVTRATKAAQRSLELADDQEQELGLRERQLGDEDYGLPPVDLLDEFESPEEADDEAEIREKGHLLTRTLGEFSVEARVVRAQRGPVITMYELSLAPGTKVSKVESLDDDLAIALKAPNVRIVAPLPGKNTVGIEVPNTEREVVGVREVMHEVGKKADSKIIPLFLGKDTAGNALLLDLASCPHLLVAGATGSGKSVAINAMITSILMTRTPGEVQLLLVDPKSVEFGVYSQLPHLICPVLSDMKKAASVLKWACKKMDKRYSILSSVGVRDVESYNALEEGEIVKRLDPDGDADIDDVPLRMPHIVIIVDEFGELMMVAGKEVESSVVRLSQKARAVGIHLICATQRPSSDVITGLIKSNLPARISFQVSSGVDSGIILDRRGAERLLGRGDMLLLPPGTSRLVRAQGSYVTPQEVRRVVSFLESQADPHFKAEIRDYCTQEGGIQHEDELYDDAVQVVVESQRGSVSLLQRRLGIGYSRAARLIDMMAEAGIVGEHRGSQARRVLMTAEEWQEAHAPT